MWNGFKVIDSDAHHHEPMDMWERYRWQVMLFAAALFFTVGKYIL